MKPKTLLETISEKTGVEPSVTTEFFKEIAKIIAEECGQENKIAIPGFGNFEGRKNDEKIVTNLATGKKILLPPSIELEFTAGGMLKKKVKGGGK